MNALPAAAEKISPMTRLVIALLIGSAFLLGFGFLSVFMEPLLPRVSDTEASVDFWEVCDLTASGQLYVMRPVDAQRREPFSTSGEPLRNSLLPVRLGDKEGESIHPSAPMAQFYNTNRPDPLPAHEMMLFSNIGSGFEYWYLIKHSHPQTHGYFAGYQASNGRFLGYLGRNGLQSKRPNLAESIPLISGTQTVTAPPGTPGSYRAHSLPSAVEDTGSWDHQLESGRRVWLATSEGIWQYHLGERTVKTFAPISDLQALQFFIDRDRRILKIVAASAQGLRLFDENGRELSRASFPWPHDQLDRQHVIASRHVALTRSEEMILIEPQSPKNGESTQVAKVSWFDLSGKLTKQTEQTLQRYPFPNPNRPSEAIVSTSNAMESLLGGLGLTVTLLSQFNNGTPLFPSKVLPYLWVNLCLTWTFVAFLWWRQLQLGEPWTETLAWTLFLLGLGSAGFLGYLFHQPWAAAIPCESCGKRRPAGQALCPHCCRAVQKPKRLDTEIFLTAPALALAQTG